MLNSKKKKIIIVISVLSVFVFISILFVFVFGKKDEIEIKNLSSNINNISDEKKHNIFKSLYNIVRNNRANADNIGDAKIRENSVTQNYYKEDSLYYGSFIVDIDSIKQSYFVRYYITTDKDKESLYSSSIVIECVPENKIIYKDFTCTDYNESQGGGDIYSQASELDLNFGDNFGDILSLSNKNQISVDLDRFIKEKKLLNISTADIVNCLNPTLKVDYYSCDIKINEYSIKFYLYIDGRLNPVKYSFSYGSTSKEYTIKI